MNPNQRHAANAAAMFHLKQLADRFVGDCDSRARQVMASRTMRDASFAARVVARSEIRFMPEVRTAQQTLQSQATRRMQELLKPQLEELGKVGSIEEFKQMQGHFLQHDWNFLRGDYASVYHEATRGAQLMRTKLERKIAAGEAPPDTDESAGNSPRLRP